jgi:hypothetical protein
VLRQNEGHNQSVKRQGFAENEHDEHADVELAGGLGGRDLGHTAFFSAPASKIVTLSGTPEPLPTRLRLETEGPDPSVAQDSNGSARRQAR